MIMTCQASDLASVKVNSSMAYQQQQQEEMNRILTMETNFLQKKLCHIFVSQLFDTTYTHVHSTFLVITENENIFC